MRIANGLVFDGAGFVKKDVYIKGKYIASQAFKNNGEENRENFDEADSQIIDATDCYVIPGLCDIHFHGCKGYDLCDCSVESIEKMAEYELLKGITSICPATMSMSLEKLVDILKIAANYRKKVSGGATLLGINMEGPFLNPKKCGAQKVDELCKPNVQAFEKLLEVDEGLIGLVDIAAELEGAMDFIEKFADRVHISLAHSDADYEAAMMAFNKGADHVTHLYNAMKPFHHRDTGIIGAAFDATNVFAEIIIDGQHVCKSAVNTAFKMLGSDRVVMISDSCRACGMEDGEYDLGGQKIYKKGRVATLADGVTLAGSVANLMDCMRVAVLEMGLPLTDVVKACCVNPVKSIGKYEEYGSLDAGKVADVLLLNKNLQIKHIIKSGVLL